MRKSRFFSFLIFLGAPHHPVDDTSPEDCASALTQASMRRFIPRLMRGARRLLRRRAQRPGFRSEGGGASVAGLSTAAGLAAVAVGAVAGATEFWASAEPSAVDKEGWKMGTSAEDFEDKLAADLTRHVRLPKPTDSSHLIRGALNDSKAIKRYTFYKNPDTKDELVCVVELGDGVCGHRGLCHGGMLAAILDDVTGAMCFHRGEYGCFTANLDVNYRKPVRLPSKLLIRCNFLRQERRKIYLGATIEDGNGTVYTEATALYIKPRKSPRVAKKDRNSLGGSAMS